MLLHSMGVGITRVFTYSATSALFLSRYDASKLPYVYVIAAVVTSLFGLSYGWLGDRVRFRRLLSMNLGFTLGMFLLLRGLLELTDAPWPTLVAAVWTELLWALVHLEFWGLAGRLLDVRQAKRLFGLIGAGETSAAILGGVVLGPLVGVIGTPNLLLVAALGTTFSLLAYRRLAAVYSDRLEVSGEEPDHADLGHAPRERTSSKVARQYVRLVYAAVALSFTSFFFVDMAFLTESSTKFPDEDQLAAFLGPFAAAANTGVFIVRAFLTGPTLSRYGLTAGLLALPILVGLGSAGVVASASLGAGAWMVFVFIVGTRLVDDSLRESIDTSSVLLLYQPLSPENRNRTMAVTEGIISPLAGGAAGLCLLLLDRLMGLDAVRICGFVLSLAFAWVALVLALRSSYLKVLLEALGRRRLTAEGLSFTDGHTVAALRRGLASPHPPEVIYCLGILEGADPDQHRAAVEQLLDHSSAMVRREAVERVERLGLSSAVGTVRTLALGDPDPKVRGAAIRALCALGEEEAIDEVVPLLDDPDPEVRMGAMVGLLRNGGIDGVMAAGVHLRAWVSSGDPRERAFAARVLGAAGIRGFYRPLLPLLEDPARRSDARPCTPHAWSPIAGSDPSWSPCSATRWWAPPPPRPWRRAERRWSRSSNRSCAPRTPTARSGRERRPCWAWWRAPALSGSCPPACSSPTPTCGRRSTSPWRGAGGAPGPTRLAASAPPSTSRCRAPRGTWPPPSTSASASRSWSGASTAASRGSRRGSSACSPSSTRWRRRSPPDSPPRERPANDAPTPSRPWTTSCRWSSRARSCRCTKPTPPAAGCTG